MAVIDSLLQAKSNLAAELASVTALRKPNYTVGQQTFDWVGYSKYLMDQIKAINDQINVENPFEEEIIGMT